MCVLVKRGADKIRRVSSDSVCLMGPIASVADMGWHCAEWWHYPDVPSLAPTLHCLITFDSTSVTLAFALRAYEFSIKTWNLLFSKTKAPDLVYVHMVLVVLVFVLICGGGRCGAVLAECDVLWARKELWQMTRYITSRCSPAQPGPCITAATRWPATTTNQSRATEHGAQSGLDSW